MIKKLRKKITIETDLMSYRIYVREQKIPNINL